jgi:hypothetical protein
MNYPQEAARRYPLAKVIGDGPFCVAAQNGGVVYLAMTESQQQNIALGMDSPVMLNLRPINFDAIPDIESPEERRQRRREARA